MIHDLNLNYLFFPSALDGTKGFEIRFNDRGFDIGHYLRLWELKDGVRTGRWVMELVTFILRDTKYGMQDGYVVMATTVVAQGGSDAVHNANRV